MGLREVMQGYRSGIARSLLMVTVESISFVTFPFVIGLSVDSYLNHSSRGLVLFGALGLVTLALVSVRRLHDVRLYSRIYQEVGVAACEQGTGLSATTARLNMLREVVDFLEHSMPTLVGKIGALVGSLLFLIALNHNVFVGALVVAVLIVGLYAASTPRTLRLNHEFNDEYERRVDVLRRGDSAGIRRHIGLMNRRTIRLSDIETVNFALSFSLSISLQAFAIVSSSGPHVDYGTLLSVVLYVYRIGQATSRIPDYWQEYVRLRDILRRLRDIGAYTS